MEILKTHANIGPDRRLRVDVPVHESSGSVDVVVVLQPAAEPVAAPKGYEFRDLVGSLQWKGDAVAEQRRLRDEW